MNCILCDKELTKKPRRKRCVTCNDSMTYTVYHCMSCYKFYSSLGMSFKSVLEKRVEEIRKENNL